MKALFRSLIARRLERAVAKLIQDKKLKVVGVTGSVGKTSTKLAIAHVLSTKYKVLAHQGNYNSEVSLPLSVFELDVPKPLINPFGWIEVFRQIPDIAAHYPYEVLVLELGADHPGDIKKFMTYLNPDIGVLTAIQHVHLEQFKDIEAVLHEKWHLAEGSKVVLLNEDDDTLRTKKTELKKEVHGYGLKHGDFVFFEEGPVQDHFQGKLDLGGETVTATIPGIAETSLRSAIAGAAVGHLLGMKSDEIVRQLSSLVPFKGRMNPLKGKKNTLIIDDSYNASPGAVLAALDTLYKRAWERKIAILGSMNELGDYAKEGHEKVGKACGQLDLLVTIGENANQWIAPEAKKAGAKDVRTTMSPYEAGALVASLLREGDTVLVKGSQNRVFAEEAIKYLLENPSDAQRLVRQTESWLKQKKSQFKVK
jgi:UDP-N-acetylmuramoyl-tripeptide--D-alanyl-D-alanine ligase